MYHDGSDGDRWLPYKNGVGLAFKWQLTGLQVPVFRVEHQSHLVTGNGCCILVPAMVTHCPPLAINPNLRKI